MRKIGGAFRTAACVVALMLVASAGMTAEMGHGGMKMEGHGKAGGHDMAAMGEKVFSGKIGPWNGTARLVDMKAQMAASGMKTMGAMPNSHHLAFAVTDAAKKPVTEGKGTVTVTGPDRKEAKADLMVMQGHFGADVNLPKPGKYQFDVVIESGGKKGSSRFSYDLK